MLENVADVCKPGDEDRVPEVDRQVVVFLMQENFNLLTQLEEAIVK